MSRIDQFEYLNILGRKVESIYKVENYLGVRVLLFDFGQEIMTMTMNASNHKFELELYTHDEWIRSFSGIELSKYYQYSCFEGKVIKNIGLINQEVGRESLEFSFKSEDKAIRIGVLDAQNSLLDLDMIRLGVTTDFSNKTIGEVEALIYNMDRLPSDYVKMPIEIREVYYYYTSTYNVFELASYIYEIFKRYVGNGTICQPRAYELARRLIY